MTPPWYVLTGGPCAGKTTLVHEFERRHKNILPEAARIFFEEQLSLGRSADDVRAQEGWLLDIARRKYHMEKAVPAEDEFFFDRGVPDSRAYYRLMHVPEEQELTDMIADSKYRKVFLLDLVDFQADAARTETPQEAARIHEAIRAVYSELGYQLISVPVLPVPERADFILEHL